MKILLVDDHVLFRDGMRCLLRRLGANTEIMDADDFAAALMAAENHPDLDLALLDLNLPGAEGASLVKQFRACHPAIPLVVVSGEDRRDTIGKVMSNGAMGFISKQSSADEMTRALSLVLDGGIYLPPQLLPPAPEDRNDNEFSLTVRQMDVLQRIAEGMSNRGIAEAIQLTEGTVKIHVSAIFAALHVNRRADAVNTARRLGMLPEAVEK